MAEEIFVFGGIKQVIHAEKEFPDTEDFRELTALRGVWKFPNPAKCASLAWGDGLQS